MNKEQKAYALAKAKAQTLFELQEEHEAEFLKGSGYTNEDGEIPERMWMIDDEKEFSRLCAEFDKSPLNLTPQINAAEEDLRKAEDALIDYALSIVPAGPRETLNRNRNSYSIRKKMLDLAFKLDTRTVRKGVRA